MKTPVIAIGLDAAEPSVIEQWILENKLKNLASLREEGAYGRLQNFEAFSAETPWTTFLTGCSPQTTGYWSPLGFKEGTYDVETLAAYDYQDYPPFYALGEDYRVAVFDMPQTQLFESVNGPQMLAWGAHSPQVASSSSPVSLFQEVVDKHGVHPGLHKDYALCLDIKTTKGLQKVLKTGISRRSAICQDFLEQENWDLFLTVFGESHAAGHNFWQLSQPDHPLYNALSSQVSVDPLLDTFQAIDRAIGEIISKAPRETRVVVFSAHGMGPNTMDLPSTTFLPELLYRFSFPGQCALAKGDKTKPVPPIITHMKHKWWERHVWGTKEDTNFLRKLLRQTTPNQIFKYIERFIDNPDGKALISPFQLSKKSRIVPFEPATWYAPLWPSMKAFALPSFSEGYIRINLEGREPNGIIAPSEYNQICDEIINHIKQLKDSRHGIPMAKEIIRTRTSPYDTNPKFPDADLVICWQEDYATDVVDSPIFGRIGPVPHYRSGSHRSEGFILAKGEGIIPNSELPKGHALDLSPTILNLMGAPIPDYFEGSPLPLLSTDKVLA